VIRQDSLFQRIEKDPVFLEMGGGGNYGGRKEGRRLGYDKEGESLEGYREKEDQPVVYVIGRAYIIVCGN
jgi:hypothetical protein